ncbi:MAG: protein-L-isoaspartate O-methyltransferase [bacterium]|uniref:Protein-L-isoaspartate O-methyltransferase n=2 Tax=Bacteria candidate phyla TaxID=1783234 RepID=A0A101I187_UNCT6|nr:MAG: Protein-L-isoaspartate carboxylmethyltransferase [candidate division TA06 bacterium 32_111]KUK86614.1 MAG: Protein-L-isoaspartate carboxylmethyltransferase [candidate division TA06 bacterium 34_109]MDI6701223.1 protein-L-isoaspartate O-methyltransferase [bacterium]HAF07846.1 hypothetical protein [candidate division WOR-3 bacterium]HCP17364.1 hypothetical protein [candidate division WOR-3 bacterium]
MDRELLKDLDKNIVRKIEEKIGKIDEKFIESYYKFNRLDFIENVCLCLNDKRVKKNINEILSDQILLRTTYNENSINFYVDDQIISSISSPAIIFYMLKLLDPKEGNKILEIGSGVGYTSALLSYLIKNGHIFTIEINDTLFEKLKENIKRFNLQNVYAEKGDGGYGMVDFAPYDRILVSCTVADITSFWVEQLKEGGKIVAPLSTRGYQVIVELEKVKDDKLEGKIHKHVHFFPLKGNFSIVSHYSYYEKSLKSLKKIIEENAELNTQLSNMFEKFSKEEIDDFLFYLSINDQNFITYYPLEGFQKNVCYGIFVRTRGSGIALMQNKKVYFWGNEEAIKIFNRRLDDFIKEGKPKMSDYTLKVFPGNKEYLKTDNEILIYRKSSITVFSK